MGNIGGRERTGSVQNPRKNSTPDPKSSVLQGSEPKVILNKSHGELSISAIHNRQILAERENCNFQKLKVHFMFTSHFCISINLNLCQNRPKISHLMTHIKWLFRKPKKPNLTQAEVGAGVEGKIIHPILLMAPPPSKKKKLFNAMSL